MRANFESVFLNFNLITPKIINIYIFDYLKTGLVFIVPSLNIPRNKKLSNLKPTFLLKITQTKPSHKQDAEFKI